MDLNFEVDGGVDDELEEHSFSFLFFNPYTKMRFC